MRLSIWLSCATALLVTVTCKEYETNGQPSVAYDFVDVLLNATAQDVAKNGARPTVISRSTYIVTTSMYDAWAVFDAHAVPTTLNKSIRAPIPVRHAEKLQNTAVAYAAYRALISVYPDVKDIIRLAMVKRGLHPDDDTRDATSAPGIGNLAADAVIQSRDNDSSNHRGDMPNSDGTPYSDYTGYVPVNTAESIVDPDRWQPIVFYAPDGRNFTPKYLTPYWGTVTPFGLTSGAQFRPTAPPRVGTSQLKSEVDQVVALNADMPIGEKARVEFFRDGPQSTSQSGQWLTFGQSVSKRDGHDLEKDVKMFFGLGVMGLDAFIASWEAKRFYDSSRPWTLVRHLFAGKNIRGWGGPGKGTVNEYAEDWHPYSPMNFITPPFPGYVSGHSTVSGASSRFLELFTGSDSFGYQTLWNVGSITEPGFPCAQIQREAGNAEPPSSLNCTVNITLPTFSATANQAGFSRLEGGFHIQADNVAGLAMGRSIANFNWGIIQSYFNRQKKDGKH
jgi:PAP2 superfamily